MSKVRILIIILALSVFGYAGYRLYGILNDYKEAEQQYSSIAEEYTTPKATAISETAEVEKEKTLTQSGVEKHTVEDSQAETIEDINGTEHTSYEYGYIEDGEVPLIIDWNALKQMNSDVIGWIYVEAFPSISYPIMQTDDNDFYLHRGFNKQYLYAGSIFLDYRDSWMEPASVIYGHNMKNGSMFAKLKKFKNQETYDNNPYFWILTPEGNYRYHIYAVFDTTPKSVVYSSWNHDGDNFLAWEKELQNASYVKNNVMLTEYDHTVILSTCHPNHVHRTVIIGRCCSSVQPPRKAAE